MDRIGDARALAPASGVDLHMVGETPLLFDAPRQRIFRINGTVALVWRELQLGKSPFDAVMALAEACGISARHVLEALDNLHALGLVSDSEGRRDVGAEPPVAGAPGRWETGPSTHGIGLPEGPPAAVVTCRLLGISFRIELPLVELGTELTEILRISTMADPIHLRLVGSGGPMTLVEGDRVIGRCESRDGAVPMILAALVERAILYNDRVVGALHASAVRREKRTVLLVGGSGAGKSTLAAALSATGFERLADDTVALLDWSGVILPVRLPPSIKTGSWPVLMPYLPEIATRPIHRRADGTELRYLARADADAADDVDPVVGADVIVFPSYDRRTDLRIESLSPDVALARLLSQIYLSSARLSSAELCGLIAWVERARSVSLHGSSLTEMIASVKRLCV